MDDYHLNPLWWDILWGLVLLAASMQIGMWAFDFLNWVMA